MAAQRSRGKSGSSSRSRNSKNGSGSAARARSASKLDTGHLEGREPSHDPDVFVDINKVQVEEIYVDVEQSESRSGLPETLERAGRYDDVAVERRVTGATDPEEISNHEPQPRTGGAEHNG